MLNIEYLNPDRMAPAGSELINYIQNNSTPTLDLLVREAIQNSLDAADGSMPFVRVSFEVNEINSTQIAKHFDGIKEALIKNYGDTSCTVITIKDSNTTGLTGPIKTDGLPINDYGNLCKLVYDINKKQQNEGAGGAWGIGKTIFFRLGIGLVIYYTRIKTAEGYEERLVASLIEDQRLPNAILPERKGKTQLGIAWWGEKEIDSKKTIPLTSSEMIHQILNDFAVTPYAGKQTGTTVIVPYVDTNKLIKELCHEENPQDAPIWCRKDNIQADNKKNLKIIEEYLNISIRKWYAPRISHKYDGQYLYPFVNGKAIECDETIRLFNIIQQLYHARPNEKNCINDKEIISEPVSLRERFSKNSIAGWINFIKLTDEDLGCYPPYNQFNPYYYLFNYLDNEVTENQPIILFTRKQGMIVNYQIKGSWVYNIPPTKEGEYIIGFFIANPEQRLKDNDILLDEYLRKGEKADHMDWSDINDYGNLNIVDKIQRNVASHIKKKYAEQTEKTTGTLNVGLGRKLARLFMPPTNFSTWDKAKGGHANIGGTGGDGVKTKNDKATNLNIKHKRPTLEVINTPLFEKNQVTLPIRIIFANSTHLRLTMLVQTETGNYTCEKWEKQMAQEFPIEIRDLQIASLKEDKNIICNTTKSIAICNLEGFNFCQLQSSISHQTHSIDLIAAKPGNYILEGNLIYSLQGVKGSIQLNKVEEDDEI